MPFDFDCVVVGGGIVGLAVAREMAGHGLSTVVLEAESLPLTHTSSRNSEVIHAGIYYPEGSLKAQTCVAGKALLYDYCERRGVAHRNIGKYILAVDAEDEAVLDDYVVRAAANGVTDLVWRDTSDMRRAEPAVRCTRALWSPSTGILDTHAYALALQGDLEADEGLLVCGSRVARAEPVSGGWSLHLEGQDEAVRTRRLVNAAGLGAVELARRTEGLTPEHVPQAFLAIGHYYTLAGRSPFNHLVYPTAGGGGLGVHVTLDIGGQVRFGPDVTWVDEVDYAFDDSRRDQFIEAIRRYYPALDPERLAPGYTGIRPKIAGPGEPAADFVVQGHETHGQDGLVNMFGIESPGITASLALARLVADRLGVAALDTAAQTATVGSGS
ncbi:MAG: NAD(P)/FAD-dependent oxidoreductase [Pseudomonadota bacterium]